MSSEPGSGLDLSSALTPPLLPSPQNYRPLYTHTGGWQCHLLRAQYKFSIS